MAERATHVSDRGRIIPVMKLNPTGVARRAKQKSRKPYGLTHQEIADLLGMSPGRVAYIEMCALKKLEAMLKRNGFRKADIFDE
jgi:hypothetical protein